MQRMFSEMEWVSFPWSRGVYRVKLWKIMRGIYRVDGKKLLSVAKLSKTGLVLGDLRKIFFTQQMPGLDYTSK